MSTAACILTGAKDIASLSADVDISGFGIRCNGTGGNVKFTDGAGNTHTWPIAAGETLPYEVRKIFSTANGTTATSLSIGVV